MTYKYNLKKAFTPETIEFALDTYKSDSKAAKYLSSLEGAPRVSRQNVTYWRKQSDKPLREIVNERKSLRKRSPEDWKGVDLPVPDANVDTILVIPDLHIPYHHQDAFEFLSALNSAYNPQVVVNLGDEVDNHALSFHDSDPNLDSAGMELARSRKYVKELEQIFPKMFICHSNHGSLAYRRAKAKGIPVEMIRSYREILFPDGGGGGWEWNYQHSFNTDMGKVLFKHQCTGDPVTAACHEGCNLIVGHKHASFEIQYKASSSRLYFGGTSGCLIDKDSLAFAYGKEFPHKPILGATVILDGVPYQIPMLLDSNGRWVGFETGSK